uniref:Transmembrane protein n=1 Tax=Medicago truncatula TaxID=3880 RepID=I3SPA2_MEDTR|nr:unknown [Medicago truncatula]
MGSDTTTNAFGPNASLYTEPCSKNQSYSEKKRGRSNKSVTAPSAIGIFPKLPPLNKFVKRLLALSNTFLLLLLLLCFFLSPLTA